MVVPWSAVAAAPLLSNVFTLPMKWMVQSASIARRAAASYPAFPPVMRQGRDVDGICQSGQKRDDATAGEHQGCTEANVKKAYPGTPGLLGTGGISGHGDRFVAHETRI